MLVNVGDVVVGVVPLVTYEAIATFNPDIWDHVEHPWRAVGRCVYCGECTGVRLYQGTIPYHHPSVVASGNLTPKETKDMRERWGMDKRED